MCGICGASWTDTGRGPTDDELSRMVESLRHRGPDDSGTYRAAHAALGFRRLSILDVAGAHQPLANEDGTILVVFNGEIYNFPELRHRLEARGHTLRSSGDTEVLVHLYEDEGPRMFPMLRGMFALAIWDAPRKVLLLGRDRLGQKPLIYRATPDRISFASELKALLALPESDVPRRIAPRSLDRYLTYGYVPDPDSILEGVHKLPPAHYALWKDGRLEVRRYWEPDWGLEVARPIGEDVEALRATLSVAVREQMVSDVPLGAFLSGGVDSTIIVGLMRQHASGPVRTYSIGFEDPAFDESPYAEAVAEHLGTEHQNYRVEPEAYEALPEIADQFDEPFADSSALPTWFVSREARRGVTVALTGDAGDELFGGYDRYRALALSGMLDRLPSGPRRLLGGPIARAVPASSRSKTRLRGVRRFLEGLGSSQMRRYYEWMTTFSETARISLYSDAFAETLAAAHADDPEHADPFSNFAESWGVAAGRDPITRAMVSDLLTYLPGDLLPKVDMASMAHSLECRGPFLDHRVVELALAMPLGRKLRLRGGRSKAILKRTFAEMFPAALRNRPKMGFAIPIDRWFRGPLRDQLRATLLDPVALDRGFFRPEAVERLVVEHVEGRDNHAQKLWNLLMLELWFRHQIDRAAS